MLLPDRQVRYQAARLVLKYLSTKYLRGTESSAAPRQASGIPGSYVRLVLKYLSLASKI